MYGFSSIDEQSEIVKEIGKLYNRDQKYKSKQYKEDDKQVFRR